MRCQTLLIAVTMAACASVAAAAEVAPQRLFHIERNKNANIVVYDATVQENGSLPEKDPVEVYWLKLAEDGARKNLKRIERKMAYGFKVKEREGDRLVIDMVADIGRHVLVENVDGVYRAHIEMNGRQAVMEKVYIFAEEGGILPSVKYIELFGQDVETGEEAYEKYLP